MSGPAETSFCTLHFLGLERADVIGISCQGLDLALPEACSKNKMCFPCRGSSLLSALGQQVASFPYSTPGVVGIRTAQVWS